jgi:hypothetical protein
MTGKTATRSVDKRAIDIFRSILEQPLWDWNFLERPGYFRFTARGSPFPVVEMKSGRRENAA